MSEPSGERHADDATPTVRSSGRRRRTSARRGHVIEAAGTAFASRGVARTTMDEIAAAAGVSKPFIYAHFESKEALVDAVVEEALEGWLQRTRSAVRSGGPVAARVAARVRASVDFAIERPVLKAILEKDGSSLRATHAARFSEAREQNLADTRDLIREGSRSGELDEDLDADATARVLELLCHALVQSSLGMHAIAPIDGLLEAAERLIASSLRRS